MTQQNSIRWFDPNDLLSYNALFNFVIGVRGGGKSFGTLNFCINRFLRHGEEFIYLRRYEKELDESKPTLFDALKSEGKFPNYSLYCKGNRMYADNGDEAKVMGYTMALSTSMKKKSIPFSNVKWIIFEEFMVDGVTSRYLGGGEKEVEIFNNLYETVDRLRDETRVFFVANAFSRVNIYFTYYGIHLPEEPKRYTKQGAALVCVWTDEGYLAAKRQTRFYQLVKNKEFALHAYSNKFILDKKDFLANKSPDAEFHFGMVYMGKEYGVWVAWNAGRYYVTANPGPMNSGKIIALTLEDNLPNNVNIRRVKNMPFMRAFRRAVDENRVYYNHLQTWGALKDAIFLMQTTR